MGVSKSEEFTKSQNDLAAFAKALAHPARIAILEYLSRQSGCQCSSIVDNLPLSQSTVSQHLSELRKAGLITGSIEGPRVCYCIDQDAWTKALAGFNGFLNRHIKCC